MTGRPSIGKTTVVLNTVKGLRDKGYTIGGMLSREVRERGTRIGFEITTLPADEKGWLAHVNQSTGPQVGKYKVNLHDLDQLGVSAIQEAIKDADIVIVDEVGPMELFSPTFKQAIKDLMASDKFVLGVIHHSARDPIIDAVKTRKDTEIIEATIGNRQDLHNILIQKATQFLAEVKGTG